MEDTIIKENNNAPVREGDGPRVNQEIRVKEVRLIDENGENKGIVSIKEALSLADEAGFDLIEISPQAVPPVCKIMDYGKYKYEQQKKKNEARKNQKIVNIKELKLRPMIDVHDYEVKVKQAKKFLEQGDKVKFIKYCIAHPNIKLKTKFTSQDIKCIPTDKFLKPSVFLTNLGYKKNGNSFVLQKSICEILKGL